jgi:hypothetical protein
MSFLNGIFMLHAQNKPDSASDISANKYKPFLFLAFLGTKSWDTIADYLNGSRF